MMTQRMSSFGSSLRRLTVLFLCVVVARTQQDMSFESLDFTRSVLQGSSRPTYLSRLSGNERFVFMSMGSCPPDEQMYITSKSECEAAAASLKLDVRKAGRNSHATNPYGCYYKMSAKKLFFGLAGTKSGTDSDRVSICYSRRFEERRRSDLCFNTTCGANEANPPDQCKEPSICKNGVCVSSNKMDGTACDDGDSLTSADHCIDGKCVGIDLCGPVKCPKKTECASAWKCLHGECVTGGRAPDYTPCDDHNDATQGDHCWHGICVSIANYEIMSHGYCPPDTTSYIMTREECQLASIELKLKVFKAGRNLHPTNPLGCYYKRSSHHLYFGTVGTKHRRGTGREDRVSICKSLKRDTIVASPSLQRSFDRRPKSFKLASKRVARPATESRASSVVAGAKDAPVTPSRVQTTAPRAAELAKGRTKEGDSSVESSSDASTSTAHLCAEEGGYCFCDGTIAFGNGARWKTVRSSGSVACSSESFGDPDPFSKKRCYCREEGREL